MRQQVHVTATTRRPELDEMARRHGEQESLQRSTVSRVPLSRRHMLAAGHSLGPDAVLALQRTVGNRAVSRILGSDRRVIQRITQKEWLALYEKGNFGLRFQPGAMPRVGDKPVQGDMYGLTDERYDSAAIEIRNRFAQSSGQKPSPVPTIEQYNAALATSVSTAVSWALTWLDNDKGLTLEKTFDKIREAGQLVLMNAPHRAARADYSGALASIGKRTLSHDQFRTRIPLITPLDYDHYRDRLGETWQASWRTAVRAYLVTEIQKRVNDAITLLVGGKLSPYSIPPDWDEDPKQFFSALSELDELLV